MDRAYCLPPIPVSQPELLMFRLQAHLSGMSIAGYVRAAGVTKIAKHPRKTAGGYCPSCGDHSLTEAVDIDYCLPNSALVKGVPASRCAKCSKVYEDVKLGAILDEDAGFLPPGQVVEMHDLLAPAS